MLTEWIDKNCYQHTSIRDFSLRQIYIYNGLATYFDPYFDHQKAVE
jgi:hypothetical protein